MPEWIVKYWVEWLFGIVAAVLLAVWRSISQRVKKVRKEQDAIKAGLQALLRAQMINDYNKWSEARWAPIYARENFENCWKQYENLGKNGVMQDIRSKFLALPTQPPKTHGE